MAEGHDGSVPADVVYRWSLWRDVAVTTVSIGCAVFVGASVGWLFLSRDGSHGWSEYLESGPWFAASAVVSTCASVLFDSRRRSRLRFGADEVELVAARRDGVLIPWSVVSRAQVRWVWPFSMLDFFVAAADEVKVSRLGREGHRPFRRRRGEEVRFSLPIADLTTSTAGIRVELRRRGLKA